MHHDSKTLSQIIGLSARIFRTEAYQPPATADVFALTFVLMMEVTGWRAPYLLQVVNNNRNV